MKLISGLLLAFFILTGVALDFAGAQSGTWKHPRVAELEDSLNKDASAYIRARFPDRPFLVNVSINPLRRVEGVTTPRKTTQRLPYMDIEEEEILDEWDNPEIGLYQLLSRVVRIKLTLSLPSDVSDDEANELKDALFIRLNLLPARDEVLVQRREWKKKQDSTWILWGVALASLMVLFSGLYMATRSSLDKITSAIREGGGGRSPAMGPIQMNPSSNGRPRESELGLGRSADLKLSDPVRTRELVLKLVGSISERKYFPTLTDMMLLEKVAERNPEALGSVFLEFPEEVRNRVFAHSSSRHWLEAFVNPGPLGMDSLDLMERLMRNDKDIANPALETTLLVFWRLPDVMKINLLKSLGVERALALVSYMPKSVALNVGKRAFPGNWASLLSPDFHGKKLTSSDLDQIREAALSFLPLRKPSVLDTYRQDQELLEYLRTASLQDEREIYDSLQKDSSVWDQRPPFFQVLEGTDELLGELCNLASPEMWALSLLNVQHDSRKKVTGHFSEKQRLMFTEALRKMDGQNPSPDQVGQARESIARTYQQLAVQKAQREVAANDTSSDERQNTAA